MSASAEGVSIDSDANDRPVNPVPGGWRAHVPPNLIEDMELHSPDVVKRADLLQQAIGGERMIIPLMVKGVELGLMTQRELDSAIDRLMVVCGLTLMPPKGDTGE
jgi:hypothetical protein